MAAHRYWRLNILGNGSDVYSCIEWQLFATIGGPNVMFPAPTGANVVVDGDFSTAPGPWTTYTGVTISGGVMNASNSTALLTQPGILTVGQTYQVTFTYTMTAGSKIRITNSATANGTNIVYVSPVLGASGTYTGYFTAVGTAFSIEADTANFSGTIDNVSVAPAPLQPALTANSTYSGTSTANIIDGVVTGDNCWAANFGNGGNGLIVADFGASNPQAIVEFALTARNGWPYQCPTQGSLQWSDDNITYTDLFTFNTSQFNSGNETKYFTGEAVPTTQFAISTAYGRAPNLSVPREPLRNYVLSQLGAGSCYILRNHTGKHYSEYVITTLAGTVGVGALTSTFNANSANALGFDNNGFAYRSNGVVVLNNVTISTLVAYNQGDRVDMAVDPLNYLVWFRVNGGNWNNNAANDPAAGVGGIDFSSMAKARLYPGVGFSATGGRIDGHFKTTDFVGTAPTGYGSYDAVEYTNADANGPNLTGVGVPPAVAQSLSSQARCTQMPASNDNGMFSPAGTITTVSGVVQESGSPVANRRVDVYDRATSQLLGTAYSAADGSWSIPCNGRPAVRVVCSDPTTYDSMVYDNVVPA